MTRSEIVDRLRRRLTERQARGEFDSLSLVETAVFLEKEFGVRIEAADLTGASFRSVEAIARLVESRRAGR